MQLTSANPYFQGRPSSNRQPKSIHFGVNNRQAQDQQAQQEGGLQQNRPQQVAPEIAPEDVLAGPFTAGISAIASTLGHSFLIGAGANACSSGSPTATDGSDDCSNLKWLWISAGALGLMSMLYNARLAYKYLTLRNEVQRANPARRQQEAQGAAAQQQQNAAAAPAGIAMQEQQAIV